MPDPALYRADVRRPNDGTWSGQDSVYLVAFQLPTPEDIRVSCLRTYGWEPQEVLGIIKANDAAGTLLRDSKTKVVDVVNKRYGRLMISVSDDQPLTDEA